MKKSTQSLKIGIFLLLFYVFVVVIYINHHYPDKNGDCFCHSLAATYNANLLRFFLLLLLFNFFPSSVHYSKSALQRILFEFSWFFQSLTHSLYLWHVSWSEQSEVGSVWFVTVISEVLCIWISPYHIYFKRLYCRFHRFLTSFTKSIVL